jgi:hypothetical protein
MRVTFNYSIGSNTPETKPGNFSFRIFSSNPADINGGSVVDVHNLFHFLHRLGLNIGRAFLFPNGTRVTVGHLGHHSFGLHTADRVLGSDERTAWSDLLDEVQGPISSSE